MVIDKALGWSLNVYNTCVKLRWPHDYFSEPGFDITKTSCKAMARPHINTQMATALLIRSVVLPLRGNPRFTAWELLRQAREVMWTELREKAWEKPYSTLAGVELKLVETMLPTPAQDVSDEWDGWRVPQHLISIVRGRHDVKPDANQTWKKPCKETRLHKLCRGTREAVQLGRLRAMAQYISMKENGVKRAKSKKTCGSHYARCLFLCLFMCL